MGFFKWSSAVYIIAIINTISFTDWIPGIENFVIIQILKPLSNLILVIVNLLISCKIYRDNCKQKSINMTSTYYIPYVV